MINIVHFFACYVWIFIRVQYKIVSNLDSVFDLQGLVELI